MQKYIEVTGKTEDEALTKGLSSWAWTGTTYLWKSWSGEDWLLGIGSVPAKVKITYEALTSLKEKK